LVKVAAGQKAWSITRFHALQNVEQKLRHHAQTRRMKMILTICEVGADSKPEAAALPYYSQPDRLLKNISFVFHLP